MGYNIARVTCHMGRFAVILNRGMAVTLEDQLAELGGISAARVRLSPPPGEATVGDLLAANIDKRSLYELVDGTLVEKAMG